MTSFPAAELVYDPETAALSFKNEILRIAERHQAESHLSNISFYKTKKISDDMRSSVIIFADLLCFLRETVDFSSFLHDVYTSYNRNYTILEFGNNETSRRMSFKTDLVRMKTASSANGIVSVLTGEEILPYFEHSFTSVSTHCAGQNVIVFTPFHYQPFVQIENKSFTWHVNASGINIQEMGSFVDNSMFRETDNSGAVFISAEIFQNVVTQKHLNKNLAQKSRVPKTSKTQALVSLSLMCISTFCLLITFITHALFHVLRTQPGINNMVLCAILAAGYLLFAFGSNRADLNIGCKAIGGAIHFFWLLVFFWMNVCSFHMFRVFGTLNKPPKSTNKITLTLAYLLYSILCTLILMGINSGVTSLGYGPDKTGLCYIYEPVMTVYTMAVPALCVVLVNILMFLVVVTRVQPSTTARKFVQTHRNYFSIYAKLSTITGMSWIVAIPMMLVKSAILEYIFIVLTCTQGIYLMAAFVCTKRVLKLYTERWILKDTSGNTSMKHTALTSQKSNCSATVT